MAHSCSPTPGFRRSAPPASGAPRPPAYPTAPAPAGALPSPWPPHSSRACRCRSPLMWKAATATTPPRSPISPSSSPGSGSPASTLRTALPYPAVRQRPHRHLLVAGGRQVGATERDDEAAHGVPRRRGPRHHVAPRLVSHEDFKVLVPGARCVVRTGKRPYANVLLRCGVPFARAGRWIG